MWVVIMYITEVPSRRKNKTYSCVLLRESYRESGKVKNRTIANLSHCSREEIEAMKLALKHKSDLSQLVSLGKDVDLHEGQSIGAVWVIFQMARRLGVERALGVGREGRLALWQVMARIIEPGSRLSAVRLAQSHAACDVLGTDGFCEDDLYANLKWLEVNQTEIERRLFQFRRAKRKPEIFLYDVTSTYLEGDHHELGYYGYNRDGKSGKKQIVVGLLCDELGLPVSIQLFPGNTQDVSTFAPQVKKAAKRFGCERVTFVGDRGMIKDPQKQAIEKAGFHYITAITKAQIRVLIERDILQMELFDESVCEVMCEGLRYVLRRNPQRARDIMDSRLDKKRCIETLVETKNKYLQEHKRAKISTALKNVTAKIEKLRCADWLVIRNKEGALCLDVNKKELEEISRLDGCYVIQTDLPAPAADAQTIHERYKDLTKVERAFRTCKTEHLDMRPVFLRKAWSTRGYAVVVMLAYVIDNALQRAWSGFDLTIPEAIGQLSTLCTMEMKVKRKGVSIHKIPQPRETTKRLLKAIGVRLPETLPKRNAKVVIKRTIVKRCEKS